MSREKDIFNILTMLSIHYPQAGHSIDRLRILAQDWTDDLGSYPTGIIKQAAVIYRQRNKFFPCVADMLELCQTIYARQQSTYIPEEVPLNRQRSRELFRQIREQLNMRG